MKFLYEYRTSDNARHDGFVVAPNREAAFVRLKEQGVKPFRLVEAPGFFNKLFGKGKRWLAIGVLSLIALVALAVNYRTIRALAQSRAELDSPLRRQLLGDAAVIEKGIGTGWADVFELPGERFLASFAVPGFPAALRNTTEGEVAKALDHVANGSQGLTLEARQIVAVVEGMKDELRRFLADGGTISEYGDCLVRRQEEEIGYYNRAKAEVEAAKGLLPRPEVLRLWEKRNDELRKMGIRLVAMP